MHRSRFKKKKSQFDSRALLIAVLLTILIIFISRGGFGALAGVLLKLKSESSIISFIN